MTTTTAMNMVNVARLDIEAERMILADWLEDEGRSSEATIVRAGTTPFVRVEGRIIEITKSVYLNARRWFQRTYGNTYHVVDVEIDGALVYRSPRTYGYGTQCLYTANDWLVANGHFPGHDSGSFGRRIDRRYFDPIGIVFSEDISDVKRQRDL